MSGFGSLQTENRCARLVVLALGVLVLTLAGSSCGGDSEVHEVEMSPEPTLTGPLSLTEAQREEALRIVDADPRIQELFGDRQFTVEEIGVWHTSEMVVIGSTMVIRLHEPKSFGQTDWPNVGYDPAVDSYLMGTIRASYTDVTTLQLSVDLTTGEVVEIIALDYVSGEPDPEFIPTFDVAPGR